MMKIAVLIALVAACSADVTSYSYSAVAPFSYPYTYGAYPYTYSTYAPYAPYAKSLFPAHVGALAVTPFARSVIAAPAVAPAVVAAAPVVATVPAFVKSQYHAQDPMSGSASYGHMEPGQTHTAIQDAAGNKVGSFSHVLPDGSISRTDYVADAMGYRVASNSLPVNVAAAPLPVSDTAEVVAARAAHFAEVEKVKSRSKRAIAYTGAYAHPLAYSSMYTSPMAYSTAYTPAIHTASPYYPTTAYAYGKYPYYY